MKSKASSRAQRAAELAAINASDARAESALQASRIASGRPAEGASSIFISNYKRPAFLPQDIPGLVAHFIAENVGANPATGDVATWRNAATGQVYVPTGSPNAPKLLQAGWDGKDVIDSVPNTVFGLSLTPAGLIGQLPLGGLSAFVVVTMRSLPPNDGNQFRIISGGSDTNNRILLQINNSTGTIQMRWFNQVAGVATALLGPVVAKGRNLLSFVHNGVNTRLRVNGGGDTTGDGGAAPSTKDYCLVADSGQGSSALDGWLAEIVMYNRTISLAEQTLVETYLNSKWACF